MKGFILDFETGDICVERGSIAIADVEAQVVQVAITAFRGEFKENPMIGGELKKQLGGSVDVMWPGKMKKMLKACGVVVSKIIVDNNIITIK